MGIGAPSPHSGPPHRFPAAASRAGVVVVVLLGCRCLFHRETSPSRAVHTPDPGQATLYHIPPPPNAHRRSVCEPRRRKTDARREITALRAYRRASLRTADDSSTRQSQSWCNAGSRGDRFGSV